MANANNDIINPTPTTAPCDLTAEPLVELHLVVQGRQHGLSDQPLRTRYRLPGYQTWPTKNQSAYAFAAYLSEDYVAREAGRHGWGRTDIHIGIGTLDASATISSLRNSGQCRSAIGLASFQPQTCGASVPPDAKLFGA